MTIAPVQSSDDLSLLVEELREHTKVESMGIVEESDDEEDEGTMGLQESYNTLLEKTGEYARVAKASIKKMKRVEQNYKSLLVWYKQTKCEVETLNGEVIEAYSKIKFLELEVIQANAKVERVSSKKLDEVLVLGFEFVMLANHDKTRQKLSHVSLEWSTLKPKTKNSSSG